MPAFKYRSIIFHALWDRSGWAIIGVKFNNGQKTLAELDLEVGEELARQFADKLAKNLAGKPSAEVD